MTMKDKAVAFAILLLCIDSVFYAAGIFDRTDVSFLNYLPEGLSPLLSTDNDYNTTSTTLSGSSTGSYMQSESSGEETQYAYSAAGDLWAMTVGSVNIISNLVFGWVNVWLIICSYNISLIGGGTFSIPVVWGLPFIVPIALIEMFGLATILIEAGSVIMRLFGK